MFADVVEEIRFKSAFIAESVHIRCGGGEVLQVEWYYRPRLHTAAIPIISAGRSVDVHFEGRVEISRSTLIINSVQANDSGIYTCIENTGQWQPHHVSLSVYGKLNK